MSSRKLSATRTHAATLRVYVSATCATCAVAYERIAQVRQHRPQQTVEIINLDQADIMHPAYIFGTPTYCLNDAIVALGNPSLPALLAVLDRAVATEERTDADSEPLVPDRS